MQHIGQLVVNNLDSVQNWGKDRESKSVIVEHLLGFQVNCTQFNRDYSNILICQYKVMCIVCGSVLLACMDTVSNHQNTNEEHVRRITSKSYLINETQPSPTSALEAITLYENSSDLLSTMNDQSIHSSEINAYAMIPNCSLSSMLETEKYGTKHDLQIKSNLSSIESLEPNYPVNSENTTFSDEKVISLPVISKPGKEILNCQYVSTLAGMVDEQPMSKQSSQKKTNDNFNGLQNQIDECDKSIDPCNSSSKRTKGVLSWDDYFMSIVYLSSMRSKDPSTQFGACIVNPDNRIVGIGYNGFPIGCNDNDLPWSSNAENELDTKYPYMCHAELNAILNKNSADLKDCRMYVGMFPCNECAKTIIQTRIKEVVFIQGNDNNSFSITAARRLFYLAGVSKIFSYFSLIEPSLMDLYRQTSDSIPFKSALPPLISNPFLYKIGMKIRNNNGMLPVGVRL